jgi:hypothetical protein
MTQNDPEQMLETLTRQAIMTLSTFLESDETDSKQIGRARVAALELRAPAAGQ